MFTLRRVTSEGRESNIILGSSYNRVWREEPTKEGKPFNEFDQLLHPCADKDKIFGFIVHDNGSSSIPLYVKSDYFIMCSDGKTYDRIRFKN